MGETELATVPRSRGDDSPPDVAVQHPNPRKDFKYMDIVRLYAAALFRFCWGRLRDRHLAEDAVQETLLRACRIAGREPVRNMGGWLFGTARRCCLEIARRRGRPAERAVSLESISDPAALAARAAGQGSGDGQLLDSLLEGLDDEERSLVYLKHVSGLKCREIAESTGVPVGTVTSALARIYTKLRASFGTGAQG
jgi:RNA polymerase sigma-70 factor (ECF subfamily)